MNIEQLKTFCAVAETLSFTEAAKIQNISQPAVSRQIATLEAEIGAKLFERGHNTLMLTRAGDMLYEELPARLSDMEKVFFDARLVDQGKLRRIKIGVLSNQCPDEYFLNVCRSMRSDNYYVRMQQYDFHGLKNAVLQRDIDVAVSICWVPHAFDGCGKKIYKKEALCLAVNTEFAPEIPKERSRESLATFSRERPTMIPRADCFPKGQLLEVAEKTATFWDGMTEESLDVIVPMVQCGIGSALVNEGHILSRDSMVVFYPIDFLEPVEKGVFWLAENKNDAVKDFLERMDMLL